MPRRHGDQEVATEIALSLGRRLRYLRQHAGWTQAQVSASVSLTPEAYARLERGRSLPSFPTLLRLANTMGVTVDALLGEAQHQMQGGSQAAPLVQDLALEIAVLNPSARESIRSLIRQFSARAA
ncbi:MAG: helix-turn-helix domain-containing protein [Deltaproteobacteria bacterium]|nr:helix-turn-helix domain-containing protein [Deltaproteobacteria bacterium]